MASTAALWLSRRDRLSAVSWACGLCCGCEVRVPRERLPTREGRASLCGCASPGRPEAAAECARRVARPGRAAVDTRRRLSCCRSMHRAGGSVTRWRLRDARTTADLTTTAPPFAHFRTAVCWSAQGSAESFERPPTRSCPSVAGGWWRSSGVPRPRPRPTQSCLCCSRTVVRCRSVGRTVCTPGCVSRQSESVARRRRQSSCCVCGSGGLDERTRGSALAGQSGPA